MEIDLSFLRKTSMALDFEEVGRYCLNCRILMSAILCADVGVLYRRKIIKGMLLYWLAIRRLMEIKHRAWTSQFNWAFESPTEISKIKNISTELMAFTVFAIIVGHVLMSP